MQRLLFVLYLLQCGKLSSIGRHQNIDPRFQSQSSLRIVTHGHDKGESLLRMQLQLDLELSWQRQRQE